MIGTNVRLGFDATAVQRGLAGLGGMFGRATRQIGIGGLRQVGAQATDLMGRLALSIPNAVNEMMDWSGNMTDMSAQTGVSIQSLLKMEEALRMTGASAADTSRMMSVLKDNLYEATQGAEAQKTALNKLGFYANELAALKLDEAFYSIGAAVADLPDDFQGLEGIMADLFGAKAGYKMIRFFKDFEGSMKTAQKNVAGFADVSDRMFGAYDNLSDVFGRWTMLRRNLSMAFFGGLAGADGVEMATKGFDMLFDKMNGAASSFRGLGQALNQELGKAIEVIGDQGIKASLGDLFNNLGKNIGKGIMESVKESIDMSPGGLLKSLNPFASNTSGGGDLFKETQKTNQHLLDIKRKGTVGHYA